VTLVPETPRSYPYPDRVARAPARAAAILAALKPLLPQIDRVVQLSGDNPVHDTLIVSVHLSLGDCRALCRAIRES
jgi:hypothetical protein